ncbi:hypothetical protein [Gemmatimonas sp.]|uniref:hypothetical protein n=1 Tax=Gemmatimonas sp. TaxID=1962908 RepID=UPI003DA559E5
MFRSSIRAALLLAAVTVMCQAAFPTVASAQATPVATDTAARRIVLKLDPPFFFTGDMAARSASVTADWRSA